MTTLLAIDDSKTMRKVLEITFAGEDYQTVLADNADDALAKLRSEKPTVVLVDHDLGGQSGYDLCQRIKSEAPGTRVLILSSKQHPYDSSRGTAAGADEHMDKPFDTQQMLDKVNNMLRAAPAQPSVQAAVTAPAPAAHAAPVAAPAPVAAKPRSQTLAYGTPAPTPAAAPSPAVAAPVSAPQPPRTQTYPGTPAVTPRPAPVAQRPAVSPSPAAPPVAPVAAAPVAAPAAPAVAAHTGNGSELAGKLQGLGLNPSQVEAVLALSREVVEQVVWEVVPVLAETMIKEEIRRLTQEG
ncbi:MAG: response regulator transcription factor [Polyangiaceae bacterium]